MKHHLKEQRILDYLFGLSGPKDIARIEQHLADCPDCRRHAELLRQRFAALETLRETGEASERLIAQTLRRIRTDQATARETRFPAYAWLGGAAAAAALLLAVFVVAPRIARQPAVELARLETPEAAPAAEPTAPAAERAARQPIGAESVRIPGAGMTDGTLTRSAPEIPAAGMPPLEREAVFLEADQVLSDAAGKPPAPVSAMAKGVAADAHPAAESYEARAYRTAAPMKEKRAGARVRKARIPDTAPAAIRLPKGWSYSPTNQVRVMLIPLKSKADGLRMPPVEGWRTRYWQVRVLNDATNAQPVCVTKTFQRPGWDLQLLNEEGRLVLRSELSAVIETDVPAGGFRAVQCMISEPLEERSR